MVKNNTLDRLAALEAVQTVQRDSPPTAEDADKLTDDEVLAEAVRGMGWGQGLSAWKDGTIRVTFSAPQFGPAYWQRVADRANVLRVERRVVLFPLNHDAIDQALDRFASGMYTAHPRKPQTQHSHVSVINVDYRSAWGSPESHALYSATTDLTYALDQCMYQMQGGLLESNDQITAILKWVYNDNEKETNRT